MTNEYLPLRIALAEGLVVQDEDGDCYEWDCHNRFLIWTLVRPEPSSRIWVMVECSDEVPVFGPNSKVVPDPSVPEYSNDEKKKACISSGTHEYQIICASRREFTCLTCGAVIDKNDNELVLANPPSLTYDEALKAEKVSIIWPDRVYGQFYSRKEGKWWTTSDLVVFDLAERRGYFMEVVE